METFVLWNKKKRSNIEEEFPYMFRTPQGWEIVKHGMDANGMLVIIAKRKRSDRCDYPVCRQYSARSGVWAYGSYPGTMEEAMEIFMYCVKYPEFDPYNARDVDFMRYGRFNYNNTGRDYLQENDYRDPGFDTFKAYTGWAGDNPNPTREEWERIRARHIIENPSVKRRSVRKR